MEPKLHHSGSKEAWTTAHKDQEMDASIPNVDEDWVGEPIILEI